MNPLLSIGITSYKRLAELERCINSIKTKYADKIEVIVSEDCSPLSNEIGHLVNKLAEVKPFTLKFMPNVQNLGYDMNLGAIIKKSKGDYVFLCSDDDAIFNGSLDLIIEFLDKRTSEYGVLYAPFVYSNNKRMDRNHSKDMVIAIGESNACKLLHDSILFSGLIFNKKYVEVLDSSRFKNMNYFQVYMFLKMIYKYGGYYFSHPSILCVGDGENAYGIAESSGGNPLLANRNSVLSNLEFIKSLVKVIKIFDSEEGTNVSQAFNNQHSFRSYTLLSMARTQGISFFKDYWKKMNSIDNLNMTLIAKIYYYVLLVFGTNLSNRMTYIVRRVAKRDYKCKD